MSVRSSYVLSTTRHSSPTTGISGASTSRVSRLKTACSHGRIHASTSTYGGVEGYKEGRTNRYMNDINHSGFRAPLQTNLVTVHVMCISCICRCSSIDTSFELLNLSQIHFFHKFVSTVSSSDFSYGAVSLILRHKRPYHDLCRLDLPLYNSLEELEGYLTLVINIEITGFTID